MHKKIVILGTGGTIAGTAQNESDHLGYVPAQVGIGELIEAIPALRAASPLVEQLAQIDSKDMSFAVWTRLAVRVAHFLAQDEVQGIVITHGTDTLEETAYFLQAVLAPSKPVVLTCAMRPATALMADGPQNIVDAVAVARYAGANGVVAVCAGTIHSAHEVQKVHSYQLNAFGSGDAGPIGYVEQGNLRLVRNWPQAEVGRSLAAIEKIAKLLPSAWPRVEILMSYAGADGAVVRALVHQGVQGLVVAATGNGTVHQALEAALLEAQAAGVRVLRASRCLNGRVFKSDTDLLPDAQGLSPVKARIALMLELMG